MASGALVYRSWRGPLMQIRVRDCPNPAAAVKALEELLGTEVTWKSGG